MSSRKGNVLLALDVLDAARSATRELMGNDSNSTVLGAIKYAFLKQRIGGDIIYNSKESVSLEGNSGPYLQYAHARARGILRKSKLQALALADMSLQSSERPLVQKLGEYSEVIEKAQKELLPHYICTYLYELAQEFNRFYEKNQVVGNDREAERVTLVEKYATTLKNGLAILGIEAPEQM
jgi:arginyl-tRNA synthetase